MRRLFLHLPLLVVAALSTAPLHAQTADIPDWFMNPPRREGWVTAVAQGQSKIDALGYALGDIADQLLTKAQRDSMITWTVSSQQIGSIRVQTLSELFIGELPGTPKGKKERTFRRIVRLTSADSSARLQAGVFEEGLEGEEEIERTLSLDGELRMFIDALSGIGGRITTAENSTGYYVMVSVPQRALRP
jgi:hypothetical protein